EDAHRQSPDRRRRGLVRRRRLVEGLQERRRARRRHRRRRARRRRSGLLRGPLPGRGRRRVRGRAPRTPARGHPRRRSDGRSPFEGRLIYRYDEFDERLVRERIAQFRGQIERRLDGRLTEDQFKPLRLMNGVYLQLHSYMLRVAIPYGELNSKQLRALARIARTWDRGYGHFTTRSNIQFHWPALVAVPEILEALAEVEMHAIQTSGNCIRNVTVDPYAGVAADEVEDPRPWAELIRQWSTFHPEFSFLPRKFKIAVIGAPKDRAAMRTHDVGLEAVRDVHGALRFRVF